MQKRSVLLAILATLVLGTLLWTAPAAKARSAFDGNWSVLIATTSGACDQAYRYGLQIANGVITYPDQTIPERNRFRLKRLTLQHFDGA
jgi:hypothetical protein